MFQTTITGPDNRRWTLCLDWAANRWEYRPEPADLMAADPLAHACEGSATGDLLEAGLIPAVLFAREFRGAML